MLMRRIVFALFMSFCLVLSSQSTTFAAAVVHDPFFCEENSVLYSCEGECTTNNTQNAQFKTTADAGGCGVQENGNKANEDQVWGYFVNQFMGAGYSKEDAEKAAAGIMGNWQQESAFNPARSDGAGCPGAAGPITGGAGTGIAQWCGGRQQELADFAADRGKDWTCLAAQLDFTWQEMQDRDLVNKMRGLEPRAASFMFDRVFEVSEGSGERGAKGEAIYTEYTGRDPLTTNLAGDNSGSSSGSGSSSSKESCPVNNTYGNGAIPSADCQAAVATMNELHSSGRVDYEPGADIQKDLDNCTTNQISCGTGGGQGGANPTLVRGLDAVATNSGAQQIDLWNMNTGHGCDEFDHPKGLASDIKQVDGAECTTDEEACKKVFDYLIANADQLNVKYVIWYGSYCASKQGGPVEVYCNTDHNNHIHVSFNG